MKITITEEQYRKLIDEEISTGTFLIYHRTDNDPMDLNTGYKPSSGDWYGRALYGCYDIEEQLKPKMKKYGKYLVQYQVPNTGKFLIYDKDVNIKLNGRYIPFKEQLRRFMGGDFSEIYANNKELIDYINDSLLKKGVGDLTANEAEKFFNELPVYIRYVDGFIYTGSNDGRTLVLYNVNIAIPLKYSDDDAKTWINILDKRFKNKDISDKITNQYQKSGFEPHKISRNYHKFLYTKDEKYIEPEFFHKYLLGIPSEERLPFLNKVIEKKPDLINNDNIIKILDYLDENERFPFINKVIELNNDIINTITIDNIDQILDTLFENERSPFINKVIELNNDLINIDNIVNILDYLNKNERLPFINKVIELNKNFIKTINGDNIRSILRHLPQDEPLPFINKVINSNKNFINTINGGNINKILRYLPENEQSPFINKIIGLNKDFINTITGDNIINILYYLPKNERLPFINKVIEKNKDFINTITGDNIGDILYYLHENEKSNLMNILTKKDDFNQNVDVKMLYLILRYSKRPISLFKRLSKEKRSLIKNKYNIKDLLDNSINKESVTKLLKHYNMIWK